jgi:predicted porin
MNKKLLAAAIAGAMMAPAAAFATPTPYGVLNLFIVDRDSNEEIDMESNTSAVGLKGSHDLGNGMSAIYKVEFQIDPTERNTNITDRDQWGGVAGSFGKVTFGTMSSNYKQMGGKNDELYRTPWEGRGTINVQSQLHNGAGAPGRGRTENLLQYTTPSFSGLTLVGNYTFDEANGGDETAGIGVRYAMDGLMLYGDYLDAAAVDAPGLETSAFKVGGRWSNDTFEVGAQYEITEDVNIAGAGAGNYAYLQGVMHLAGGNHVTLTYGMQEDVSDGLAVAFNHDMGKHVSLYVGYGDRAVDDGNARGLEDDSVLGVGARIKM